MLSNIIKATLVAGSIYLAYSGYSDVSGGKTVISDEAFPGTPSKELQDLMLPLETLNIDATDALVLSRAFRDAGKRVSEDKMITDLNHFSDSYKRWLQYLFNGGEIAGKYEGKIDKVLDVAFKANLAYLYKDGEVKDFTINDKVRTDLVKWLNAASWKFHQIFEATNAKLTPSSFTTAAFGSV